MPNVGRQRNADRWRVTQFPVDTAEVIEVGDMVFQSVNDIRAADQFTFVAGSLPRTQANFRRDFMGIALEGSTATESRAISVAQKGVFAMDCASAAFEIGDRVGPDDNAGATALLNQQVIAIGENGHGSIGKVHERAGAAGTTVLIEIDTYVCRPDRTMVIPIFSGLVIAAEDLVTNWIAEFPFKLVAIQSLVTIDTTVGAAVISVRNGAATLDDTHSIAVATKGAFVRTVMDDATGDDRFNAEDPLDLVSDGGATAGEATLLLEIIPFLHEQ